MEGRGQGLAKYQIFRIVPRFSSSDQEIIIPNPLKDDVHRDLTGKLAIFYTPSPSPPQQNIQTNQGSSPLQKKPMADTEPGVHNLQRPEQTPFKKELEALHHKVTSMVQEQDRFEKALRLIKIKNDDFIQRIRALQEQMAISSEKYKQDHLQPKKVSQYQDPALSIEVQQAPKRAKYAWMTRDEFESEILELLDVKPGSTRDSV